MDKKRILKLFARMNGTYGGTWSARFPDARLFNVAVQEWAEELEPFSDGEIEQAYKLCKQRYTTAPTLPQFRELVKMVHFRLHERPRATPPHKPVPPEVAHEWLEKMRGILDGSVKPDAAAGEDGKF